jgi:geranylgeranyl pyrophosphate synthase
VDDLLAWEGDEQALERPAGSDRERGRRVAPAVLGAEGARGRVFELLAEAEGALRSFGEGADVLRDLIEFVRRRGG